MVVLTQTKHLLRFRMQPRQEELLEVSWRSRNWYSVPRIMIRRSPMLKNHNDLSSESPTRDPMSLHQLEIFTKESVRTQATFATFVGTPLCDDRVVGIAGESVMEEESRQSRWKAVHRIDLSQGRRLRGTNDTTAMDEVLAKAQRI